MSHRSVKVSRKLFVASELTVHLHAFNSRWARVGSRSTTKWLCTGRGLVEVEMAKPEVEIVGLEEAVEGAEVCVEVWVVR